MKIHCYENRHKLSTFVGVFLLNLTGGIPLYIGNASISIFSYAFVKGLPGADMSVEWMIATVSIVKSFGLLIAKTIYNKIGLKSTAILGVILFSSSMLASYLSIGVSMSFLLVTFVCVPSLAIGLLSAVSLNYLVTWDEKNAGKVTSLISLSYSIGSGFTNLFITSYINPDNKTPTGYHGVIKYFIDDDVILNVPRVFLYIGTFSLVSKIIGLFLIKPNTGPQIPVDSSITQNEENIELQRVSLVVDVEKERNNDDSDGVLNVKPLKLLRSSLFYGLCLLLISSDICSIVFFQHYKTFGQNWISDDEFLTSIGTTIAWMSILSRFLWAVAIDKFETKGIFMGYFTILSTLLAWLYLSATLSRWSYFFMALGIGCTSAGQQVLFIPVALNYFGKKYFTTNLALIRCSSSIINFIIPDFSNYILDQFGWSGLFSIVSAVQLTTAIGIKVSGYSCSRTS